MNSLAGGIIKVTLFVVVAFTVVVVLPRLSPVLFPDVPERTPTFDCDDGTLYMYRHFQSLGIEATPILGNLHVEGEEYLECNHVWLLVKSGEKSIAYDWGEPYFDRQHYEGYIIDMASLLYAVADDMRNETVPASNKPASIEAQANDLVGSVGIEPTTNRL